MAWGQFGIKKLFGLSLVTCVFFAAWRLVPAFNKEPFLVIAGPLILVGALI